MTNVNATVTELSPNGGTTLAGLKIGYLPSTALVAGTDTITITNAAAVQFAALYTTSGGTAKLMTSTGTTAVLTGIGVETGPVHGTVYYR